MSDAAWVAVIVTIGTVITVLVNAYTNIRVAELKSQVREVHSIVNSKNDALMAQVAELGAELNLLKGANLQRAETDASAATFEAGRKEGAEGKGA